MALPKEPRQKMINVMYIVLTALLALNVSNEVLNAFRTVNQSIDRSNVSITDKNQITYDQFIKQMQNDPEKVRPLKEKADSIKKMSQQAYSDIETLKQRIVTESGGRDENGNIKSEDNLDAATRVMENKGAGPKLKKELEELRKKYLSYVDPSKRAEFEKTLPLKMDIPPTNNPENKDNWTAFYFDMTPSIAAVTMLSKFQNDIKNAESLVVDELLREISANDIKFDKFAAIVSYPTSPYVLQGQPVEAEVRVGAYSSTVKPTITINGQKIPVSSDGVGTFKTTASSIGPHALIGRLTIQGPNGEPLSQSFPINYTVGASSMTVSADAMNVLFIGVDNPVSVGVSGVPSENVSASITQGSLSSKGRGKYVAKVTSPGTARVNVSAVIDGQKKNMGSMEFRVARIPDPVPEVAGKRGGTIPAAVFRAQIGVVANLKDFYFDARYIVTSFKMGFNGTGYPDYIERTSSSARFTPEMQQLMQRAKPGSRIYIDNIKARGPDGTTRDLGSINFTLQ